MALQLKTSSNNGPGSSSGTASASGPGHGYDTRSGLTKGIKNGTSGYLAWCSAL